MRWEGGREGGELKQKTLYGTDLYQAAIKTEIVFKVCQNYHIKDSVNRSPSCISSQCRKYRIFDNKLHQF